MNELKVYLHYFAKLRRDRKNGGAPHKPILLLALIELLRKGEIYSNRIEITPELVLEFKSIWSKLVITQHQSNFALPFYHMKSEPFWRLITKNGVLIPTTSSGSIKSFSSLKESVAYAEIDKTLFNLMQEPISREVIIDSLLSQYFPETRSSYTNLDGDLFNQLENQILNEERQSYVERIHEFQQLMTKDEFEEEVYIRGGVFKREIPKIYDYECAVSGMRIEATINVQLVDACHIVPFAVSKDDTITNGISLSPNIHRAFDRGLITINDQYVVRVSPAIKEKKSPYSLGQFDGKQIHLPSDTKKYPSIENLNWHRKERFVL